MRVLIQGYCWQTSCVAFIARACKLQEAAFQQVAQAGHAIGGRSLGLPLLSLGIRLLDELFRALQAQDFKILQ